MALSRLGSPLLYDEVTGDIVGWKDPDGSEHLFSDMGLTPAELQQAVDQAEAYAAEAGAYADLAAAFANPYTSTTDGIANTSGTGATNRFFSVLIAGSTTLATAYRNDSGVAVKLGDTASKLAIDEIVFSLEKSNTIGLSTTPLTGTFVTANTRVFETAVTKTGIARKLRTYSKNTGQSITLRRFVSTGGSQLLLGDVLTQVGSDYVIALDSADSAKELTINFPVNAGEFIGIYGPSFIYPGLTVGTGATMGQAATAGNYTSLTVGGFGTGYKWQIGIDIAYNYVNTTLVSGLESSMQTLGTMSSIGVSSIYDLPPSPKGRHGVVTGTPKGSVYSDGTVWHWTRDDEPVPVPWMRILDLASRDGWTSVFDFTNNATISTVETGGIKYVSSISDALGNAPPALQATQANRPELVSSGIGGVPSARFSGGTQNLRITDAEIDNQPYCILAVTKFSGPVDLTSSTGKFAFSGVGANRPGIIGYDNSGTMTAWHGNGVAGNALSNSPTVFGAVFDGEDTTAYENGWLTSVGLITPTNKLQLGYIGADYQGQRGWIGDISAMLVYLGNPGQDKIERMQELLADVFGIPVPGLEISALGATVTRLSDMKVLYEKAPSATGHVASVTKVMTALVLDRRVSDLSQTLTVVAGDIVDSGTTLFVKAGDIISYQDLMFAALLPSDNNAATAIARGVGYIINPGAADDAAAKAAFYAEMNVVAALLAMSSTTYNNSYEGCTSNATDLTKLLAHISTSATRMLAVGSQATHSITVTGANPRTYVITSTIYPPFFPGYAFGKTGTGDSYGSLVFLWDRDGERYASVMVRSFPSTLRYREARWLMDEAIDNPIP